MIFQALYELAEREELVADPAYEPLPVAYLIKLGAGGKYLGYSAPRIDPPVDAKGKAKGKPKPPSRPVPRRSDRTSGAKAEFLVDKAEYVLGVDPKGTRGEDQLEHRRGLFRDLVRSAREDVKSDALTAVEAFLDQVVPIELRQLVTPEKANEKVERAGEWFGFIYEPDGGLSAVHDDPEVKAWFRARLGDEGSGLRGDCLVTGKADVPLTRLHGKPKGIPPKGKTKGGVPLTSVNAAAFKSYGLDDIQCAPISQEANIAIETALNRLLDPSYRKPDGTACPPRSVLLSSDTIFLFWSKEESQLDWITGIESESPDKIADLLRSPHKSGHAPIDDPSAFYALILSGAQGRGIVRSFLHSTVARVAEAVDRYRQEVRILRPYGDGEGSYGLRDYRRGLVPRRDLDHLPPALASDLYLAILFQRPYPNSILQALLRRNRVEFLPKRERGEARDDGLLATRCSLLKAWLIRNRKENLKVSLDKERSDAPYRLGRLLAVIDRLQQDALGSVNATLVDRYYGSASSTPGAVFPTLLRRSQHHLGKLRREKPGLAVNTEKLLQEVVSDLSAFPQTMTLEAQGLFALGFYHQRQDFFTKKESANA
jgi:CRISPR-associated protein Csd1